MSKGNFGMVLGTRGTSPFRIVLGGWQASDKDRDRWKMRKEARRRAR